MEKDPELLAAVDALRRRIGDTMVLVDHWEADLTAVGIARRGAEARLAYITVKSGLDGSRFYVALEEPPTSGSNMPYTNAGEHDDLTLMEAAEVVAQHLGVP